MTYRNTRRDFLQAASAATLGAIALTPHDLAARAAEGRLYPGEIIDTHQHLWDLKQLKLPWVAGLTGKPKEILGRDYLPADYAEASRGLNVVKWKRGRESFPERKKVMSHLYSGAGRKNDGG